MKTDKERIDELRKDGWTPLEAQEIIDIEDGKIKPEDAELVCWNSSDNPLRVDVLNNTKIETEKQKKNFNYIYHLGVQALRNSKKNA